MNHLSRLVCLAFVLLIPLGSANALGPCDDFAMRCSPDTPCPDQLVEDTSNTLVSTCHQTETHANNLVTYVKNHLP